jgi:hypothetical protein
MRGSLRGGAHNAPLLGDGHFGHARFKKFSFFDFDGHLFGGWGGWVETFGC